jgi:sacsin
MDPALQKYQGPSLLAFNNAVFADRDFKNISRLGDSMKKDDGGTTGRFGLGFNSVSPSLHI